ncbi:uncharacterized protein isoform X7 [Danio rerio]|uniref:Uncharacterized protein isoform X7 n=1 Tax=Danio rerio TaxID=7955 RepID=A0AC58HQ87_DANRE
MASKQRNMAFVDDELHSSETPLTVHVESLIIDMNMDVEVSNYTCEDQGGMNASPEPTEDNNSTEVGYNPTDSEELCDTIPSVPASETELDMVDPEGVPGPSSSEQEPVCTASLEVDISDARNPTVPEVTKIGKFFSFFGKLFGFTAQPETDPDLLSVSEESDYESASEMDEVDMEQSCVPAPETELDLVDPEGVPVPRSFEQEPVFRETLYVDLIKPHTSINLKRSVLVSTLLKEPAEPSTEEVESSSGIDQDGISASPEIPQVDRPTEVPEMWKTSADFPMIYMFSAQHQTDPDVAEMISVSEESDYESASETDEVNMEQSSVPEPEAELDLVDPEGVPVPRSSEQEPVFRETLYVDLIKPQTSFNLKRSVLVSTLLKEPAEPSTEEVESSSGIDQDGISASPEIPQVYRPTELPEMWKATADLPMIYGFSAQHQTDPDVAEMISVSEANDYESASEMDEVDMEQSCVPEPEAELDLVDPEGVPGPSSSEQEPVFRETLYVDLIKPHTSINLKRSVLVSKLIKEPAEPSTEEVESSSGIDQGGISASPEIPQVDRPTEPEMWKASADFPVMYGFSAQHQTDPNVVEMSVSEANDYESASEMDEVDVEQTSVSDAEAELVLVDPEGVPVPSSSEQEPVFREALYVNLIKPQTSFNVKRSVLVSKLIKEPAEPSTEDVKSSRGIDQDGISASPEIPQVDRPTGFPKVKIIKKVGAFIRKRFGFSVHPKAEPAVAMDEVDTEQTSVSDPEVKLDLVDPEGVPGPSSSEKEPVYREILHVIDLIKPHTSFNLKRSVLVSKPLKEPAEPSTEDVKNSRGIDQDGLNGSSETTQVDRPSGFPKAKLFRKINAFIRKRFRFSIQPKSDPAVAMDEIDTEQTSVSDPEMELDLVDPEGVPGPSSSEQEPVPRERMDVNITDAMNPTESTKVRMISKVRAFSRKLHDISAKLKTEPNSPQPLSVPDATGSLNTSVIDEEAVDHSPETPEDHSPTGLTKEWMMNQLSEFYYKLTSPRNDLGQPGPSSLPPRNLLNEVFDFQKLAELLKIEATVNKCKLPLSPFTEVWRNVYIGDEETARNRRKLMELGVTHILNAAAPKMTWEGKPKKKGLKGKILTGPEYYEGMDIKYCGLPTTYDQMRIVKYFWPAGKFIAKALRKPDNVLFIHCKHGVSHAPTLFVAYLMMYYKLPLEEAIGYVTRARRIRPFSSFLLQLLLLEPMKKTRKSRVIRKQKGIVIYN